MIDNGIFKEIENRLYNYFRQLKEIDKLEYKCSVLEQQKNKIMTDIKNTNINIEPEIASIDYSMEKVQVSHSDTSYAEAAAIKEITKLENEWTSIKKQILKLHARIRDIKYQTADMEYFINNLSDIYRSFICLKYKDGKSLEYIGDELHMSKSTAFKLKNNIINSIANSINYKSA